jgi:type IV pilus assembly protein PilE
MNKLISKRLNLKLKAFTITELLVVLIIVGILILLALPRLMPLISKAKSTEAQLQLKHIFTLQKTYFYMNSKYSFDFNEIDYEHAKLVSEGGTGNYKIEIQEATNNQFKITATAVTDFDADGIFNVWEIDQDQKLTEVTKD